VRQKQLDVTVEPFVHQQSWTETTDEIGSKA
jgi:hypothetical protein